MNLIPTGFRPMLAATITEDDLDKLRYPVIVQPKIDGIRCIVINGVAYSRRLKLIPNRFIRLTLNRVMNKDFIFDGELILEDLTAPFHAIKSFQAISSSVMSEDGEPDFIFKMFDSYNPRNKAEPFEQRIRTCRHYCDNHYCDVLSNHTLYKKESVISYAAACNLSKLEGIIIRSPDSLYKFGRSTIKQQYLLKLKPFVDAEAEIIGMEPKYHNANPTEYNELGYAKHSSHGDGMVALPMMGALKVRGINGAFKGIEFNVGSGFTDAQRKDFWKDKNIMIKGIITYKYQSCGSKDKPRCPVYKELRKD